MPVEWLRSRLHMRSPIASKVPTLCEDQQSLSVQNSASRSSTVPESTDNAHEIPNSSSSFDVFEFFNNLLRRTPEPTRDEKFAKDVLPVSRSTGGKPFREDRDAKAHQAYSFPWAASRAPFHGHLEQPEDENALDSTKEGRSADSVPHETTPDSICIPQLGYRAAPQFDSDWEQILAYHHGLFASESFEPAFSLSEIRNQVTDFEAKLRLDEGTDEDACRYLALEEFKCLRQNHFKLDPQLASRRCVKWYNEWKQCRWDQEKVRRGIYYIDPRPERKHRPFYSAPNFRYA